MIVHWRKPGITPQERITFLRGLSFLLKPGIPVVDALKEMLDSSSGRAFRAEILLMLRELEAGRSMYEAASGAQELIPPIALTLIRSGDESGNLPEVLDSAADFLEHRYRMRQDMLNILIYPSIILMAACLTAIFLSAGILPKIAEMYRMSGIELPTATGIVMSAGQLMALVTIALIAGSPLLFIPLFRQHFFQFTGRFFLQIPLLGRLEQALSTSIWAESLDLLLSSGLGIPEAFRICGQTGTNMLFRNMSERLVKQLHQGYSLSESILQEKSLPALARRMIRAGDVSGRLPESMKWIAGYFRREYELMSRRLMVLAEPAAVIGAGLFVGLIALSVMVPVADLGSLVQ